ncbi:MAG: GGDEF domain-containing protein, partial [Candidatus Paceibacteria bacterium]
MKKASTSTLRQLLKENERLKKLVFMDELTGLLNRRGFKEIVEKLFYEIRWETNHKNKRKTIKIKNLGILFIDIDHFKKINDIYGHEAGDSALKHVANLILQRIRGIDIVARWGGEEIIVALLGA